MNLIENIQKTQRIISQFKRNSCKIVLAHGTFDLLHVGHIRYLKFAKKFGEKLIVSITADKYVKKGSGRPYFKELLRKEMLESLKFVDHVFIVKHPSAIPAIKVVKPDFYLKGEEYRNNSKDITNKIKKEKLEVKKNGGKTIYSNEITFSSSNLINNYFENFSKELRNKIKFLKSKNIIQKIHKNIKKIQNKKILLIGETIVDEYKYVQPLGKTPKENLISNLQLKNEIFAGGVLAAGTHLSSFSKNVTVLTSFEKPILNKIIKKFGSSLKIDNLKLKSLKTIEKIRYVESGLNRKLFQIYKMIDKPIAIIDENRIYNYLKKNIKRYDLVIVNDFGHNLLTPKTINYVQQNSKYLTINAQSNSANQGYNLITKYKKADYVCIDYPEAKLAAKNKFLSPENIYKNILSKKIKSKKFAITLGKDGSIVFEKNKNFRMPVFSNKVVDTMGAGDAYFVITSLFASCGFEIDEIALIGNTIGSLKTNIRGHSKKIDFENFLSYLNRILK
jgi:rfaE bifunctional protein nucleotidyltransferase chain/domain